MMQRFLTQIQPQTPPPTLGAKPEDFHPALQPLAQGYSMMLQPKPALGPGLLGSATDIRRVDLAQPDSDNVQSLIRGADQASDDGYAVTDEQTGEAGPDDVAARIRQSDIDYLDRYYDAIAKYATNTR